MVHLDNDAFKKLLQSIESLEIATADIRGVYESLAEEEDSKAKTDQEGHLSSKPSPNASSNQVEVKKRGKILLPYSTLRYGDWVLIKNPKPNQQSEGPAVGVTQGRFFIKVRTPNGSVINRTSNNLKLIPGGQNSGKYKK